MTLRAILTYQKEDKSEKPIRLFLRNGIVMNPDVEEAIKVATDIQAISLRRTGEKKRNLTFIEEIPNESL
jgi:sRNA-binding regulator protein Hfq